MKRFTAMLVSIILICSMIVPATTSAAAAEGKQLTNLYNEKYYKTHGNTSGKATFDKEKKTIKLEGQCKAMIDYTDSMTAFEASVTIEQNNSNSFYAGLAFHLTKSDFEANAFNTQGYSVILKSSKKDDNEGKDLKVIVRYVNAGGKSTGDVSKNYANAFAGFDETRKLKLTLKVDSENFTIGVIDTKTNKQIVKDLTYPLDYRGTKKDSNVYPSGNLALITNGAHTFTDFNVTSYGDMVIPEEEKDYKKMFSDMYEPYGNFTVGEDGYVSTTDAAARGILKTTKAQPVTDFSADLTLKAGTGGELKGGLVFRVGEIENDQNSMEGYALILEKTSSGPRLYLYKYGKDKGVFAYLGRIAYIPDSTVPITEGAEYVIHANVVGDKVTAYFYNKAAPDKKSKELSASLKTKTDSEEKGTHDTANVYYSNGGVGFHAAKGSVDALNLVVKPAEVTENPFITKLNGMYDIYGTLTPDEKGYFSTEDAAARGILKTTVAKHVTDFSTDLTLKAGTGGELKGGLVFRVGEVENGQNSMAGYALILDSSSSTLFLYKYGKDKGAWAYLGKIDSIKDTSIQITEGAEYVIHANVVGERVVAYFYNKAHPEKKSKELSASLKTKTDSEKKGTHTTSNIYYSEGGVGFHAAKGSVDALNLVIKDPEEIRYTGGTPAKDNFKGSAVSSQITMISDITGTEYTPGSLAEYAADFDNYTFYSSSASSKFLRTKDGIVSDTTGTKRAILDGVIVKGFHATATMRISSEGTLRSGIVFRVNNIEKSAGDDGIVGASDIEGYAAILYKTPGSTNSHARVVLCIYKYGIVKGKYTYLGTVASKASEVPLKGCEKKIAAAAGKELTIDVNVIGDQLTAYFYNAKDPSLKSEELVTDLNAETDVESPTPSLRGVHYSSGAIGLTAQNYVTFLNFTVGEPIYPSTEVGDLSDLDSYTIYGSGVKKEGEYIVANSSGTKKMMVNNLTVKDFKASVDMTIDNNGNLKAGFFFRLNEVGSGADAQTGYAIVVTRNYSDLGETNPNRIDIVIFKWGYKGGKLSYLGEVAREVYKSGSTFMNGKMAGEELTFVVSVKGAAIDATLYKKGDEGNKPATFSSNLKFAAKNETGETAYFESGSIGLYLGNSVSSTPNYTKLRNFHIDDGSGVAIKASGKSGIRALLERISPMTGQGMLIIAIGVVLIASTVVLCRLAILRQKGKKKEIGR